MHTATVAVGVLLSGLVLACSGPNDRATPRQAAGQTATAVGIASSTSTPPRISVTIRVGVPAAVSSQWPYFVAEREGFLASEGLQVDYNVMRTEALAMQALAAGGLDMIITTPGPAVLAIERGAPVQIVAGVQNRATYWLATRPEITQLADLRGAVIGTDSIGSIVSAYIKRLLREQAGLLAERDYDIVPTGAIADRLVAVQLNQTQATLLGPPYDIEARHSGLRLLADTFTTMRAQWTVVTVSRKLIEEQRPALVGFLRALVRGALWLYEPANRDDAIVLLSQRLNQDSETSAANYDLLVRQLAVFSRDGRPDLQGLQTVLEMMADEGQVASPPPPLTKYYDDQYVRAAHAP